MSDILLPKIGFSMNEAQLLEWMVADGEPVTAGQALFALESEKSITEIEAPESGILHIIVPAGEICEVGTVLGTIS